jgi:hypothetical protein
MNKTKQIFILTTGNYSSYRIVAVCSTRYKANYAKKLYGSDCRIEPHDIDKLPDHPKGCLLYSVGMWRDGEVKEIVNSNPEYGSETKHSISKDGQTLWVQNIWAKNEESAIKIANEMRTFVIANGEWEEEIEEDPW